MLKTTNSTVSASSISALTSATTPLAGTEVLPIVQSSATVKVAVSNLTAGRAVSVASLAMSTGSLVPSTAGQGVNFTANTAAAGMTSQLLNWYEEGAFTPTLEGQGTGSATLSTAYGTYTRIGRQITAKGRLELSASTLAFGAMFINGLPFASNSTAKNFSVGTVIAGNVTYTGQLYCFINPSSTAAYFLTGATGAAEGTLQGSAFSSTSTVTFSVTYFI